MPEATLPVSPADMQRTMIARQNGETYDATAQSVTVDAAPEQTGTTPAVPASGEPAQNAPEGAAASEPQAQDPTPVEGGGDEGEPAADHTEPETPETPQPGKNHVARRIDKLTRENAEMRRALEQLAMRQAQGQAPQPQQQVPQQSADPKPDPEKYTDVAQYIADTAAWTSRQETQRALGQVFGQMAQQAQQHQLVQQATQEVQSFNERVQQGSKEFKDFAQVTSAQADVEVAPHVAASLMRAVDNPAAVLYHLAKNPGEVAKLNQMSPEKVAVRLGAIEANAKRPPAISNAPRPGTPVTAKGSAAIGINDDMSMEQFVEARSRKK